MAINNQALFVSLGPYLSTGAGLPVLLSMSFIMLFYVRQKSKSLFDKNKAQSNLNNNQCALNVREL